MIHSTTYRALCSVSFLLVALFCLIEHPIWGVPEVIAQQVRSIAVSFFLVLVGFDLAVGFAENRESGFITKLSRLIFRFWPAHVMTLCIAILLAGNTEGFGSDRFFANLLMAHSWSTEPSWLKIFNEPSWIVSTLFFAGLIYVLLPGMGGKSIKTLLVITFVLTLGSIAGMAFYNPSSPFVLEALFPANPALRFFELLCGVTIGRYFVAANEEKVKRPSLITGTLLEVASVMVVVFFAYLCVRFTTGTVAEPGSRNILLVRAMQSSLPVFGVAFCVFAFAHGRGILGRFFGLEPFFFLGRMSLVFLLSFSLVEKWVNQQVWATVYFGETGLMIAKILITLGLAGAVNAFFVYPIRKMVDNLCVRRGSFSSLFQGIQESAQSPFLVISVLAAGLFLGALIGISMSESRVSGWQIVNETDPDLKDIEFENEAILKGLTLDRDNDQLKVKMAWIPKSTISLNRHISLHDNRGKVKKRAPVVAKKVLSQQSSRLFVDEVSFPIAIAEKSSYISVRFSANDSTASVRLPDEAIVEEEHDELRVFLPIDWD